MMKAGEGERSAAAGAHLAPLLGLLVPLGNLLGPLIFFLVYRDKSRFVRAHSAESFNFQVTITLGLLALWILGVVLIIVKLGFLIQWGVEFAQDPSGFEWPGWPEIGGWALIALVGLVVSFVAAVVLWVWNLVEIAMACINGYRGRRSRYTFVLRPLKPRWKELDLEPEPPLSLKQGRPEGSL